MLSRRIARFMLLVLLLPTFVFPQRTAAAGTNTFAWGWNRDGQLGNGSQRSSNAPVAGSGLENIVAVAAGGMHSLALRSGGMVVAWGQNTYGQLGDGTYANQATPIEIGSLHSVVAIAAGSEHSLALQGDGTVVAWGSNHSGQLGGNQPIGPLARANAPVVVPGLDGVVAIAAGGAHSVALRRDGTVFAWGSNRNGQFGTDAMSSSTPMLVGGLSDIVAISAGWTHSLALRRDGFVFAWGDNSNGALGDGTATDRRTPVAVDGLGNIIAIAAGGAHSLALNQDGAIFAWGDNALGQLGDGTFNDRTIPAVVPVGSGAIGVAAGGHTSFTRLADGNVVAWGGNLYGEMGIGATSRVELPRIVPGMISAVAIAGGGNHVVAATGTLPPFFADLPPGYWARDQIIAFAQRGITTGCGDTPLGLRQYCPERPVTRAEIAVLLTRTLGYATPPAPTKQTFSDVPPTYWAYPFIAQFATLGITTGCGGTEFCPERPVTRAEMASFLIRALKQKQVTPTIPTFADVPANHPQYGDIEALVSLGVTTGCGEDDQGRRLYCPERSVTRAEMAVFIIRAFP